MCMISGLLNIKDNSLDNKIRLETALKTMLVGMSGANRDGTGMAYATTDGRVFMTKTAKPGVFVAAELGLDVDVDYKHFIMHTRMATHGATNDMNAHPHETKYGYLIHNGWCPGLYQTHKASMKTGCDSEALALVYEHNPINFNKALSGSEHFAIIHLDSDGSHVRVMNKNKMLYKAHSKLMSADLFLTDSSVIREVGRAIGEDLECIQVRDGETYILNGDTVEGAQFQFTDTGYASWGAVYDWSNHDAAPPTDWFAKYYEDNVRDAKPKAGAPQRPIRYNRGRKDNENETSPPHVLRMTRKERKRWIRDNKERREEYFKFWTNNESELKQPESEEQEFRDSGFLILDADGNAVE